MKSPWLIVAMRTLSNAIDYSALLQRDAEGATCQIRQAAITMLNVMIAQRLLADFLIITLLSCALVSLIDMTFPPNVKSALCKTIC